MRAADAADPNRRDRGDARRRPSAAVSLRLSAISAVESLEAHEPGGGGAKAALGGIAMGRHTECGESIGDILRAARVSEGGRGYGR